MKTGNARFFVQKQHREKKKIPLKRYMYFFRGLCMDFHVCVCVFCVFCVEKFVSVYVHLTDSVIVQSETDWKREGEKKEKNIDIGWIFSICILVNIWEWTIFSKIPSKLKLILKFYLLRKKRCNLMARISKCSMKNFPPNINDMF